MDPCEKVKKTSVLHWMKISIYSSIPDGANVVITDGFK